MNEILASILNDTYSLTQLKVRLNILKSYLLKAFFGSLEESSPLAREDLNWLNSLPEKFYQQFNKDNVYAIFKDLEAAISKFTPLTIFLTFEPDEISLAQIGKYARKTFNSPLLLDIKLDLSLIAGCSLVWKGIQKDYSLRAKIEERKIEILDSFKKFLR